MEINEHLCNEALHRQTSAIDTNIPSQSPCVLQIITHLDFLPRRHRIRSIVTRTTPKTTTTVPPATAPIMTGSGTLRLGCSLMASK